MITGLNHRDIERELTTTLKTISVDSDFIFQLPLEINAKTNGITFGAALGISFYEDAFYMQIAFGRFKASTFMQISFRLLVGEVQIDEQMRMLVNELNTKLLWGKVILNEEDVPYLTIEHDFSAASMEQVNEAVYDFLTDLIDDDVSPIMTKLLEKLQTE